MSSNNSKAAEACKEEGNLLFKAGKYAQSLQKCNRAYEFDPTIAAYHGNAAACHEKLQDYEAMQIAAQKAVEVDDSYSK